MMSWFWCLMVAIVFPAVGVCGAQEGKSAGAVRVEVDPGERLYEIDPRFFGVCLMYWQESDEMMADGVIETSLKELPARLLRYPGGTDSDDYLWDEHRLNDKTRWPFVDGPGTMDTDEFIALCRRIGAEPLLCVNTELAFFDSEERALDLAARWVRYCNVEKGYNVRYWEVGNEPYYHTRFNASQYAALFVKMARAMKAVDPTIEVAAVGRWKLDFPGVKALIPAESLAEAQALEYRMEQGNWKLDTELRALRGVEDARAWWPEVLEIAGDEIDVVSIHWYFNLQELERMGEELGKLRALCREKVPNRKLEIILTEWTLHHLVKVDGMERALAVGEAVGKLLDGGVRMTTYWPLRCGGSHNRKALVDMQDRTITANYRVLQFFARNVGRYRVASRGGGEGLYHFATVTEGGEVAVFLVNRTGEAVRAAVRVAGAKGPAVGPAVVPAVVRVLRAAGDPALQEAVEEETSAIVKDGVVEVVAPGWSVVQIGVRGQGSGVRVR